MDYIEGLVIQSTISSRFAMTAVNCEMFNNKSETANAVFKVKLPKEAFISNFTMTMEGMTTVGVVRGRTEAAQLFREAQERNETVGMVSMDNKNPTVANRPMKFNEFSIQVAVAGRTNVVFEMTYQELLRRSNGVYTHTIYVDPMQVLPHLKITVKVFEPQGIRFFNVTEPDGSSRSSVIMESKKGEVLYQPDVTQQQNADAELGISGSLNVLYDTEHSNIAGDILTENDIFAHFFSPNENALQPLDKRVVFVVDMSGSMLGERIENTKRALEFIVRQMRPSDLFMFLLFSDSLVRWPGRGYPMQASPPSVIAAMEFLQQNLIANGATDINMALTQAGLGFNSQAKGVYDMIVFLTDGEPTSGVTNHNAIINNVVSTCGDKISLFTVGFGASLNENFLKTLSGRVRGSVSFVYDTEDIYAELKDFFLRIDSPLITDVKFSYNEDLIEASSMTSMEFSEYFEGSQIIVAGQMKSIPSNFQALVSGTGRGDSRITLLQPTIQNVADLSSNVDGFLERLYAHLKIENLFLDSLLEKNQSRIEEIEEEALQLALKHNLVTKLTSLIVFQPVKQVIRGKNFNPNMPGVKTIDVGTNKCGFQVQSTAVVALSMLIALHVHCSL
ncbi:hypothetical protein CAPTEDRAFT_95231 [Capitella teleta]|uniref:VWFA domain-containing protein n=1 Tax=Capitella teleta TaxID=283909 RepID=R7TBW2_CAPTE|nr:hypothetical protein CAPTEDRAFT_95231 [Capitella teleta]|eukprot:ELT88977.1 hypothetical protein CAPTEDRAFT_95231 [Capitella teleta]